MKRIAVWFCVFLLVQIGVNVEAAGAVDGVLADEIDRLLADVTSWRNLVHAGVVLHRAALSDFDAWISRNAAVEDWDGVLAVKRYADLAGYTSPSIDDAVRRALSHYPMFAQYALPMTDATGSGFFWPWTRYVLYGYRYAEELRWETMKWNKTSAFLALRDVREWYGRAFYRCNPDLPSADSLFGTRWHQAGSLMDCFFILYQLGVADALSCALQEWQWLNAQLWSGDHFDYAPLWPNWEFSGISVYPNVAKLHSNGTRLGNWSRISTDIQARYLAERWASPQWHASWPVVEHHYPGNHEPRIDGTLTAWVTLHTFCGLYTPGNQSNMRALQEGDGAAEAWVGLRAFVDTRSVSDGMRVQAALTMVLLGIVPLNGSGLALPLISDRHNCYAALNVRHFEFDAANHSLKIPVWGNTTLRFRFGEHPVTVRFASTGIYQVTFTSDWNAVLHVRSVAGLTVGGSYLGRVVGDSDGAPDDSVNMWAVVRALLFLGGAAYLVYAWRRVRRARSTRHGRVDDEGTTPRSDTVVASTRRYRQARTRW